jgi:hypothetical protein
MNGIAANLKLLMERIPGLRSDAGSDSVKPSDGAKLMSEKAELVARKTALETEYVALAAVIAPESGASQGRCNWAHRRRSIVKKEMVYLQQRLAEINAERKRRSGALVVEKHFMDVCRETLTVEQFSALLHHAIERASEQDQSC